MDSIQRLFQDELKKLYLHKFMNLFYKRVHCPLLEHVYSSIQLCVSWNSFHCILPNSNKYCAQYYACFSCNFFHSNESVRSAILPQKYIHDPSMDHLLSIVQTRSTQFFYEMNPSGIHLSWCISLIYPVSASHPRFYVCKLCSSYDLVTSTRKLYASFLESHPSLYWDIPPESNPRINPRLVFVIPPVMFRAIPFIHVFHLLNDPSFEWIQSYALISTPLESKEHLLLRWHVYNLLLI